MAAIVWDHHKEVLHILNSFSRLTLERKKKKKEEKKLSALSDLAKVDKHTRQIPRGERYTVYDALK